MADGWGVAYTTNAQSVPSDNLDNPDITSGAWRYTSGADGLPSGHDSSSGTLVVTREDSSSEGNARYVAHDRAGRMWARSITTGEAGPWQEIFTEASPTIAAPYILPEFRGLKISEFLTSNDPETDQKAELADALGALFSEDRYRGLDLEGRQISVDDSILLDSAIGTGNFTSIYSTVYNGNINVLGTPPALTTVSRNCGHELGSNVLTCSNTTGIVPGMLAESTALGRGIFVVSVEENASVILSQVAYRDTQTTVSVTFTEIPVILDCINTGNLRNIKFDNVGFHCNANMGAIRLPRDGGQWHIKNCWFTNVRRFGVIDWGDSFSPCNYDGNWGTSEYGQGDDPATFDTVFAVINRNDNKIVRNQFIRFKHSFIVHGRSTMYALNHNWAGSNGGESRNAQLILTAGRARATVIGNEIDNSWIELTCETAPTVAYMGNLDIVGNNCVVNIDSTINTTFRWINIRPFVNGISLRGLHVVNNNFEKVDGSPGNISRVEALDPTTTHTDFGSLTSDIQDVVFKDNTFRNVDNSTINPAIQRVIRTSANESNNFNADFSDVTPFGLPIKNVRVTQARMKDTNGVNAPGEGHVTYGTADGRPNDTSVRANFNNTAAVRGEVTFEADINSPTDVTP